MFKIGDIVKIKNGDNLNGLLMVASTPWKNGDAELVKLARLDVRQDCVTGALIVVSFEKLDGAVRVDCLEEVEND